MLISRLHADQRETTNGVYAKCDGLAYIIKQSPPKPASCESERQEPPRAGAKGGAEFTFRLLQRGRSVEIIAEFG